MCNCITEGTLCGASSNIDVWVPAIISILSLLVNVLFSVFVAPRVLRRSNAKDKMHSICANYQQYLSEIVSYDSFEGVPTQVRKYSLEIHLMFQDGTAPKKLAKAMEKIYQMTKERKKLSDAPAIDKWNNDFRDEVARLRKLMAKYTAVF